MCIRDRYEDDNVSCDYEEGICVETGLELVWNGEQKILIHPAQGRNGAVVKELIPEERSYRIELYGCTDAPVICMENGKALAVTQSHDTPKHCLIIELPATDVETLKTVTFGAPRSLAQNDAAGCLLYTSRRAGPDQGYDLRVKEKTLQVRLTPFLKRFHQAVPRWSSQRSSAGWNSLPE